MRGEKRSHSWESTLLEQRGRILRQLRENPSLKPRLPEAVQAGYEDGRLRASGETEMDLDRFPEACPYDWDAIMNQEFHR